MGSPSYMWCTVAKTCYLARWYPQRIRTQWRINYSGAWEQRIDSQTKIPFKLSKQILVNMLVISSAKGNCPFTLCWKDVGETMIFIWRLHGIYNLPTLKFWSVIVWGVRFDKQGSIVQISISWCDLSHVNQKLLQ